MLDPKTCFLKCASHRTVSSQFHANPIQIRLTSGQTDPKLVKPTPSWSKLVPSRLRIALDPVPSDSMCRLVGPSWHQGGFMRAQVRTKIAALWPNIAPRWRKLGPRRSKVGPSWPQVSLSWLRVDPKMARRLTFPEHT